MRSRRPKAEKIVVWCGVIAQLSRTRANAALAGGPLPYSLYVMLDHFCHDPEREWGVTELACAFQSPQPGITKRVQRLIDLGFVCARDDDTDGRKRWLRVTRGGIRARARAAKLLAHEHDPFFAQWPARDVAELHRLLDRLKTDMDTARDAPQPPRR